MEPDLQEALSAITEIMGYDKGPDEPEWVNWCNRTLPLLHKHGLWTDVIEFC